MDNFDDLFGDSDSDQEEQNNQNDQSKLQEQQVEQEHNDKEQVEQIPETDDLFGDSDDNIHQEIEYKELPFYDSPLPQSRNVCWPHPAVPGQAAQLSAHCAAGIRSRDLCRHRMQ